MKNQYNFDLNLIDAETPYSAISMIRELKSGKSLVVFLDGNMGATEKKENLCEINFLNGKLNVRKGVAFIGIKFKIPIVTIYNYINKEKEVVFHISKPLSFTPEKTTLESEIMEKLYDDFALYLKKYPEQWEAWSYLHKSIIKKKNNKSEDDSNNYNEVDTNKIVIQVNQIFKFNIKEFALFLSDGDFYLLRKNNLKSYYILVKYGTILQKSLSHPVISTPKNIKHINHLYRKKILLKN